MIFSWLGLSLDVSGGFVGLLDGGWCGGGVGFWCCFVVVCLSY